MTWMAETFVAAFNMAGLHCIKVNQTTSSKIPVSRQAIKRIPAKECERPTLVGRLTRGPGAGDVRSFGGFFRLPPSRFGARAFVQYARFIPVQDSASSHRPRVPNDDMRLSLRRPTDEAMLIKAQYFKVCRVSLRSLSLTADVADCLVSTNANDCTWFVRTSTTLTAVLFWGATAFHVRRPNIM